MKRRSRQALERNARNIEWRLRNGRGRKKDSETLAALQREIAGILRDRERFVEFEYAISKEAA